MSKVVVIGGSGFLGSHVSDSLSASGNEVVVFDKFTSKWTNENQEMFIGDILNPEELNQCIEGADYVYNFAGIADINESSEQPLKTAELNIIGNLNVLEACRGNEVKRIIYASSVYVHSEEGGFYRCSKESSESYIRQFNKTFGLDYTILQYGSLYGPRSDPTNGLRKIVESALTEDTIRYIGDPEAIRSYIHVLDAAESSVEVLSEDFKNKTLILSGQESMKVKDLLEMVGEVIGNSKPIEFLSEEGTGHYIRTPYSYKENLSRTFVPNSHIDLGQGLIHVIKELRNKE